MTRDDLRRFCELNINFETVGLMEPGVPQPPYFCDPVGAEPVGRTGCDGIHFVLLPDDERVFCVDPAMGEPGTYVLPVAADFREFLSFVLFCRDACPLAELRWLSEERFREEDAGQPDGAFEAARENALAAVRDAFELEPADPYDRVKALQAAFDPAVLRFSDEYYDVLGIERVEK